MYTASIVKQLFFEWLFIRPGTHLTTRNRPAGHDSAIHNHNQYNDAKHLKPKERGSRRASCTVAPPLPSPSASRFPNAPPAEPRVRVATCLLILALLALACAAPSSTPPTEEELIADLAAALNGRRLFEPRLSGPFPYAPCEPALENPDDLVPEPRCSPQISAQDPEYKALRHATAPIARLARRYPNRYLHAHGVALLLWGEDLDRAVETLEAAVERDPEDPATRNDLAAALIVRGQREDRPLDLADAFETISTISASEWNEALSSGLFNRALLLQLLQLPEQSSETWDQLRALHNSEIWRAAIEQRFRSLKQQLRSPDRSKQFKELATTVSPEALRSLLSLVAQHPQQARETVESTLGNWAHAHLRSNSQEAEGSLDHAEALTAALTPISGDPLLERTLVVIRKALQDGPPSTVKALAEGHRAFALGRRLQADWKIKEAIRELQKAQRLLKKAGSPFSLRVSLSEAELRYQLRDPSARRHLQLLTKAPSEYYFLHAKNYWMLGLLEIVAGNFLRSIPLYESGLSHAILGKEHSTAAMIRRLLAEATHKLGQSTRSWAHRYRALSKNHYFQKGNRLALYSEASRATALTHPYLSLAFAESMQELTASNATEVEAQVALLVARSQLATGNSPASQETLRQTEKLARQTDEPIQSRLLADIEVQRGYALRSEAPEQAIAALDIAKDFYEAEEHFFELLHVAALRAELYLELGEYQAMHTEIRSALVLADKAFHQDGRSWMDPGAAAHVRRLHETLVLFQIDIAGDPVAALRSAEELRKSHRFPPWRSTAKLPASVDSLNQVSSNLSRVVSFLTIGERVFRWDLVSDELSFRELEITNSQLASELDRLHPQASLPEIQRTLGNLYFALFEGIVLNRNPEEISLVLDGHLHGVPFAALYDQASQEYLIQKATIFGASSVNSLTPEIATYQAMPPKQTTVAVFAVSSFPASGLAPLPSTPSVVASLTSTDFAPRLFKDGQATPETLRSEAESSNALHISTHLLVPGNNHEYPFLILSNGRNETPLDFRKIRTWNLSGLYLSFLATCTARRTDFTPGKSWYAVRSLLEAGSQWVIAPSGPIEDKKTSELAKDFYRNMPLTANPALALRAIQLEALDSPNRLKSPLDWGSFLAWRNAERTSTKSRSMN